MADLESIIARARALSGRERETYLRIECGDDHELRVRVAALLRVADEAGSLPPGREADSDATLPQEATFTPTEQPSQMIGRYKLLEKIGEGGFGSVWAAEQREPVKRRVALKITKLGMDTRQVIARFEAERQALAMMDHPNIARVLDAGATEAGRPYFVMELVKGVPILDYCDREKLDTRSRLELFAQVCHAIQHAHQKGIIHRDIKPSNVLVTLHDGRPVPKVIDFGIAKATNAELTEKTIYTHHRQMIGTPAYMSPEQAEMSGLDIDTRSDIYSLGVLLYELLTGTTPFPGDELMSKGFAEMMRIIREVEPHKPSTRLGSLGATAMRTAQQRRVGDVARLGTLLRGDLDWIVMKCLEKDRTRRYETASGLAADIQRHLRDEPVLAGPPSTSYRLRKFVKRNRSQVIAGGVVAAVLVLGVVGTSYGLVWALREKSRADTEATNATLAAQAEERARLAAQHNEQKAIEEAHRAERQLVRATEIKRLLTDMLTSVKPEEARSADTTLLKRILNDASERLAVGEISDELIAAELHHVVGDVYSGIALYSQSESHLTKAVEIRTRLLGEAHLDTLASMNRLGLAYTHLGWHDRAEAMLLRTLETRRRVLDDEHPDVLTSMHNLAMTQYLQGREADAEPLLLRTHEIRKRVLGEEHAETLQTANNLAILYYASERFAEAEPLYRKSLEVQRRQLGDEHPSTLGTITNLGMLYNSMERYEDAARLFEMSLPIKRRILGMGHPWTGYAMYGLATAYEHLDRRDEALPLLREMLELGCAAADMPDATALVLDEAALNLLMFDDEELCDPDRALRYAQRACAAEEAAGGGSLWSYLDTLALAQYMTGNTAAAVETQKRAISLAPDGTDLAAHEMRLAQYQAVLESRPPSPNGGN